MAHLPYRRFPLAPLLDVAGIRGSRTVRGHLTELTRLAVVLGVSRKSVNRWKQEGVPEPSADAAAVHLGLHPFDVWGNHWWDDRGES